MADQQDVTEEKRSAEPPLMPCRECGRGYARESQVLRLKKKLGGKRVMLDYCPACRRKRRARALRKA